MGVNGIYGLSGSGMDIESMVKVGMMSKQNEYDKMAKKFTKNEWMKADYLELNSKITTFNASTLSQYKMSTTMNAKSAASSDDSVVTATVGSAAALMNHRVDVTALASNAHLISTGSITPANTSAASDSIYLKDILFKSLSYNESTEKFTGTTFDKVGSSDKAVTARADDTAISFFISDGVTKDSTTDKVKQAEISFTYDEVFNGNVTLTDLASKINSAGLNIRASYDVDNERFSMYNTKSGADNTIDIEIGKNTYWDGGNTYAGTVAANFLNSLQLYQSKDGYLYSLNNEDDDAVAYDESKSSTKNKGLYFASASHTYSEPNLVVSNGISGTNGAIKVDGVSYTTTDNKKTVNGVTYTATSIGDSTVSVTQDTDAIIDKVKSFVSEYNTLLADLYKKYDEKPNADYKPLTQSQKDAMKEEQITKWEEKAKAGLLYHDQTLGKVIQNMRNAIAEGVELEDGSTVSVFSLGISTTGLKGQLVLDEDKLKKALANDPDIVYNTFAKLDATDLDNAKTSGVAQRLGDIFVDANKKFKTRAGSSTDITEDSDLNNLLRQLQTRMSNFKKMMNSFEDALYKKYDAMESTLARLGTQLNFIMGGSA